MAFDRANERLFLCALGNNTVEIVDLRKGERVHTITGLGAPQGVAYIPGIDRLFVANDQNGKCNVYDGKSFNLTSQLDLKDDADNVRYDEANKRIYVGYGSGGLAILNATDFKSIGTIPLSGHPEAFELESHGPRIFVNVPTSREVAVVDRDKRETIATWRTDLAFANFPMALDQANHRLFVGCRMPSKLIVLNSHSGTVVAKVDISGDADEVFYDSQRHCIYVVGGAGKIDIIEQTGADSYNRAATVDTAAGARTGFFAPGRNTLFVAVPHRGSQPAEIRAYVVE